ncbi:MAG: NAD-dependent epimerase/dehydratase family protein [Elusimicrobia bacterium]|nr:NAD-dependent epimerase/dehydratase family protein [Elusimicrobiota bacterium]
MGVKKPRVLITGGAGFLGSHVARRLLDAGCDVIVLDFFHQYIYPLAPSFLENMQYRHEVLLNGAQVIRGNINNKEDLRRQIIKAEPSIIIHLAALPLANVALWQTEEAFDSIVYATFNLADIVGDFTFIKKFVYVSSSMIYGDFETIPMPEDGRKNPKDVYGSMKLTGEILVKSLCRKHDVPYAIIRPSAIYGPTDNNRRVLQIFVENALTNKPLEVTNPQATFLDFTYVEDAAEGISLAVLSDKADNQEFNVTRGEGRSLQDAIDVLQKIFGQLEVRTKPENAKFRPSRGALDVSKAKKLLGYKPAHSLEEGLARYVDYVRRVNKSLLEEKNQKPQRLAKKTSPAR